jgi:hypothetical protein
LLGICDIIVVLGFILNNDQHMVKTLKEKKTMNGSSLLPLAIMPESELTIPSY